MRKLFEKFNKIRLCYVKFSLGFKFFVCSSVEFFYDVIRGNRREKLLLMSCFLFFLGSMGFVVLCLCLRG